MFRVEEQSLRFLNMRHLLYVPAKCSSLQNSLYALNFAWGDQECLSDTRREYTARTDSYCCITYSCNAISEPPSLSRARSLSQAGTPVRSLWLDEAFLQARRFYSAAPCWIAPVKWLSTWSVFAVMVNEGNDSECENMLMTPLETPIPVNLEGAEFPSRPPPFPSRGFQFSWQESHLTNDVKWYRQGQWIQCACETTPQQWFSSNTKFQVFPFCVCVPVSPKKQHRNT